MSLTKKKLLLFNGIKGALNRQASEFKCQISNVHKLKDLDEPFNALEKVAEAVVKGKYGPFRYGYEHEISHAYPLLEHTMIRAKNGNNRWLSPWMSKIHPGMICFDVPMTRKEILFYSFLKGIIYIVRDLPEIVPIFCFNSTERIATKLYHIRQLLYPQL